MKKQKQRVVTWEKTDKAGNETAFASIDLRTEGAVGDGFTDDSEAMRGALSSLVRCETKEEKCDE